MERIARYERFLNYLNRLKGVTRFNIYSRIRKTFTGEDTTSYSSKYYTKVKSVGQTMTTGINTHYEDLFFVTTTTIATKSIELITNNARHTLITSTSVYLVISETDYS